MTVIGSPLSIICVCTYASTHGEPCPLYTSSQYGFSGMMILGEAVKADGCSVLCVMCVCLRVRLCCVLMVNLAHTHTVHAEGTLESNVELF